MSTEVEPGGGEEICKNMGKQSSKCYDGLSEKLAYRSEAYMECFHIQPSRMEPKADQIIIVLTKNQYEHLLTRFYNLSPRK